MPPLCLSKFACCFLLSTTQEQSGNPSPVSTHREGLQRQRNHVPVLTDLSSKASLFPNTNSISVNPLRERKQARLLLSPNQNRKKQILLSASSSPPFDPSSLTLTALASAPPAPLSSSLSLSLQTNTNRDQVEADTDRGLVKYAKLAASGATAGVVRAVVRAATHPFDTVKTRQQCRRKKKENIPDTEDSSQEKEKETSSSSIKGGGAAGSGSRRETPSESRLAYAKKLLRGIAPAVLMPLQFFLSLTICVTICSKVLLIC
uniref:Uncharacterized protein n=1 Tax=Chromera velia CCMP2878 TaxID=1169474 RepID=A0A0G4H3Z5_9ALVE|eukprot:Cvel_5666.t1-p1 / transcript=Cvel_5666.t1 / gene=Cvel_5666 / organism=Chromera_velia_CCMP2878 / gene_product=hypothetical protein / transcript_product=hypothetical protein / location=Cvel_scaffold267:76937-77716(-) / protein_length=260 / sequence_SO=supercontig / SO=protein_coding / is_pseudo=false